MPDGSKKKNYINLDVDNFNIEDKGDLQDMVDYLNFENVNVLEDGEQSIPDLLS